MSAHAADASFFSQRASALGAIVALHVLGLYALTSGLARKALNILPTPIQTEIIQDIPPPEIPPPMPEPEMVQDPRIEIPRPVIKIEIPPETPHAVTQVTTAPVPVVARVTAPVAAPAPPAPRSILHANVGKNFPNPDDFYPPSSIRMEEQGSVGVRVCIGPGGKLTEAPLVARTSGYARLDEAALKLARAGHYIAGSIDGVPNIECMQLPVRFHMRS
jgi:protein TonB